MSTSYEEIVRLIPTLNEEELNSLRKKIGAKRKTRSDYAPIVESVKNRLEECGAVSYTHLTLPTILLV